MRQDLQPASVEEELQQGKDGDVQVHLLSSVALLGVQKLSSDHTEGEERVNCDRHHLLEENETFYPPGIGVKQL